MYELLKKLFEDLEQLTGHGVSLPSQEIQVEIVHRLQDDDTEPVFMINGFDKGDTAHDEPLFMVRVWPRDVESEELLLLDVSSFRDVDEKAIKEEHPNCEIVG